MKRAPGLLEVAAVPDELLEAVVDGPHHGVHLLGVEAVPPIGELAHILLIVTHASLSYSDDACISGS
jgi:hypothetical protein